MSAWRRAVLLAAVLLGGCAGGDGGPTDSDDPSDTDTTEPIVWGTVELVAELDAIDVDGFKTLYHVPDDPIGLCFVFHGSNSDVEAVLQIEWLELYNELIPRGMAIVMTNSTERELPKQWDTFDTSPAANADFPRLSDIRDRLIADTDITATTPVVSLGFSKGGSMANAFGQMATTAGWDFRAFSMHNSSGYQYPIQADGFFVSAANDETNATPDSVQERADQCSYGGNRCVHRPAPELALHPLRFSKSPAYGQDQSENMFTELIELQFIDADGWRLPSIDLSTEASIEAAIDRYEAETRVGSPFDAGQQLRVVWATHRLSAQFKVEEAEFLVDAARR